MRHTSPAEFFAGLPLAEQEKQLSVLSPQGRAALLRQWDGWLARPKQLAPAGDWSTWVILAGRGFGKTRSGTEWIKAQEKAGYRRIAIIGETAADVRDVLVEGPSGILRLYAKHEAPIYESSKRRITWPSGAIATLYNGTEPDQLRGPEHDCALVDELAKYKLAQETWDQLQFGLRVGHHPKAMVTTTPRPIPVLRDILKDPDTVVTSGSTYDNAGNLPKKFLQRIQRKYEGTRLGRQELNAEMLEDLPGALWTREMIEETRVKSYPSLLRIVVSVDPSGTRGAKARGNDDEGGDDVGIIVAGKGIDGRGYVLEDLTCNLSPAGWGKVAVDAYRRWNADRLIAETNFGGALVEHVVRTIDPNVSYKEVSASRGKIARAEPVAALYEQKRVSHVGGFAELEDQMTNMASDGYVGRGSPDRADAMVWAMTDLVITGSNYTLDNL